MGEHLVLYVDRMVVPEAEMALIRSNLGERDDSDEPLIEGDAECRICQEDDSISNLEVPCACSGTLKFAHRKCVQRWCNEKGDIICEICHQCYQPGYTYTAPPPSRAEDAIIDIGWAISSAPLDLHNHHIMAIARMEHQLLEPDEGDYGAGAASFCRSALLILMGLLFFRHAWVVSNSDDEDDHLTVFSPFMARATSGLILLCYVVASWAICSLQKHTRQRQIISPTKQKLKPGEDAGLPVHMNLQGLSYT